MAGLTKRLRVCLPTVIVLGAPAILVPLILPFGEASQEARCTYLLLLMAIYWITESLPLPITALLPFPLCPLLGIASSKYVAKFFINDLSFLVIGGIMVGIGIEQSNLHKRIALKFLMLIGVKPRRLMLGIMLITAFLSMWISNTATTAMMVPIMRAILAKLFVTSRKGAAAEEERDPDHLDDAIPLQVKPEKEELGFPGLPVSNNTKSKQTFEMEIRVTDGKIGETTYIFHKDSGEVVCLPHDTYNPATQQKSSLQQQQHYFESNNNNNLHRRHVNGAENPQMNQDHSCHQEGEVNAFSPAQEPQGKDEGSNGVSSNGRPSSAVVVVEDHQLEPRRTEKKHVVVYDFEIEIKAPLEEEAIMKSLGEEERAILKTFSLCVCYSANFGGIATLTGTPPNLVLSGLVNDFADGPVITFASWFVFGLPICLVGLGLMFVWMNIHMNGITSTLLCKSQGDEEQEARTRQAIKQEYRKLGKIKFSEVIVFLHFLVLVFLWLTRQALWSSIFVKGYISDAIPAVLVGVGLFVFASERPNVFCCRKSGDSPPSAKPAVLNWKHFSHKFPWGAIFLLGGGFCLAEVCRLSGLSKLIANYMMFVSSIPLWAAGVVVTVLTSLVTELTSNVVIAILLLPILKDVCQAMEVNPLFLMLPAAAACSLAFMLPVATPPNALVFAYGDLKVKDMMSCGIVLNIIGIGTIVLGTYTWGYSYFSLGSFPLWAQDSMQDLTSYSVLNSTLNGTVFVDTFS